MGLWKKSLRRAAALALLAAAALSGAPAAGAEEGGIDVVILMDASQMTSLSGAEGGEPWLACPCLNPEHFYLKPAAVDEAQLKEGVTFPDAAAIAGPEDIAAGELAVYDAELRAFVALSAEREYHFRHSFLSEPEARGWKPWRYHFMKNGDGVPMRIDDGEACGCYGREGAAKATARLIAEAVLAAGEGNRVAFCAFGEAGSSRWSCPLTGELSDVLACIDASPIGRGGDHAAGLARALRLLNRRPLSERMRRRAVVAVISGGEAFPKGNEARALRLAGILKGEPGAEGEAVFGAALTAAERRCAGADVVAVGLWDGESAFLDALASDGGARFALEESETAEAAASAVIKRILKDYAVTPVLLSQAPLR